MTTYLTRKFDLNSPELLEVFDELNLWGAPFGIQLLKAIKYKKNCTALDIGFGAGFPLTELAMRLGETSRVYGIDPWEAATHRTKKKITRYGISNVEIVTGVAEELPFDNQFFDLVVSNNGINNTQDMNRAIEEVSRTMKKGGQFVQSMNLNTTMLEFYEAMEEALDYLGLKQYLKEMKRQIYKFRKPLDEVVELLTNHGFKVTDVVHDKFQFQFVDGTAMFNHHFIQLGFMDGWKRIVPEDKRKMVFERIETVLNQRAKERGNCTLTIPFVVINCQKL